MNNIIISDTSCLIALEKINLLKILKDLFGVIYITKEVNKEYGAKLPPWVIVREVGNKKRQHELELNLDVGEASSIAMALELENSLLIIDEFKGRKVAESLDLRIIGTIGLIVLAYKNGYILNLEDVILQLINSGFRLSEEILKKIIKDN